MFFNDWKSFFAWILRNGKVKVALLIVVFDSLFLAYPSVFQWMAPDPIHYFRLTSLALLILNTGLLWIWREIRFDISDASSDTYSGEGFPEKSGEAFREVSGMAAREAIPKKKGIKIDREWIWRYGGMGISLVITLWIAVYSIEGWLQRMARIPIDPQLADMLPAIQAGLDSLFEGRNPYHAYHDIASWEIRFIYGPGLWGPFIIPYLLGIDLRYITLIGGMGVPVLLLVYTIVWSRFVKDVGLLAILFLTAFTLCNNHATTMFFPVAHTFVYWPLFPIFCYTFLTERHRMSTLLLGWLV